MIGSSVSQMYMILLHFQISDQLIYPGYYSFAGGKGFICFIYWIMTVVVEYQIVGVFELAFIIRLVSIQQSIEHPFALHCNIFTLLHQPEQFVFW